jgi:hypothetical protein
MRELKLKDAFSVSRILKKMKIRPEVGEDISQQELGAQIMFKFVEGIGEAEEEVTTLLADLKGMKPDEMKELGLEESLKLIEEFKELKGLKGFFTQVGKLMK